MKTILLFLGIVGLTAAFFYLPNFKGAAGQYDDFAQCLASKDITMYGADWCPHCQSEKKAFGDSFQYVPYIECPDEPKLCTGLGIKGFPTWIFADGRRFEGELGLKKLSLESGCPLPE